jgi:hypothetical protein
VIIEVKYFALGEYPAMEHCLFESIIIEDIINQYPEYKEKLKKQLLLASVKDRTLYKYGFSVDYVINNSDAATLGQDVNLMLETDGWKINGLEHGSGYILWIKNGLIDSLEGYSYEEPWPEEITFCEKNKL